MIDKKPIESKQPIETEQPIEIKQPAEVVTGSLHNNGLSRVMSTILVVSILGIVLSGWMSGLHLNHMMKDIILVIILDFIFIFYVQMNKDKIYFPSYTWWLLGSSYLASILLLCNPYEISLYPFWLIGVMMIAAFINANLAHVFCYGLIIIAAVTASFEMDSIVMNILLGTFMCIMVRSLTKFSQLGYALILVCSMNVTLLFAMNDFKIEKVQENNLAWWILADIIVLGSVYILKSIFIGASKKIEVTQEQEIMKESKAKVISRKEQKQTIEQKPDTINEAKQEEKQEEKQEAKQEQKQEQKQELKLKQVQQQELSSEQKLAKEADLLKQALIAATAVEAALLVLMKSESEKLYHHSMVIANLSKRAALAIGANAELAYAGGWYHEIGRLTGKDYVPNGIALIQEHHLPIQIADIIRQHTFKEQLPQTKEAVIVMLSDNIVSTVQYVKNKMDKQITPEKIIENTLSVRMDKGIMNEANITIAEFTKLKEFYLSVVEELR